MMCELLTLPYSPYLAKTKQVKFDVTIRSICT